MVPASFTFLSTPERQFSSSAHSVLICSTRDWIAGRVKIPGHSRDSPTA